MPLLILNQSITQSGVSVPSGVLGVTSPAGPVDGFDFTIKQNNTAPTFSDTLSYSDGSPADLTGASVAFVMRSLTAATVATLAGAVTIVTTDGDVEFAPDAADTATAGEFMQVWRVTFPDGTVMDFPTVGYNTVRIEPGLADEAQQLVSIPDLKSYLSIPDDDRRRDARLLRLIEAVRPIVENITGPILPQTFDERHMGGGSFIQVRRRPSTSYGTTPILQLLTATEDLGTTTYDLDVVGNPALGTTYSCMIDRLGTVTRLTGGGGAGAFAGGIDSVHITYRAGQSAVPANVYEGTLELLRVNYQTTMATGRGRLTVADDQDGGVPLGFFMPRRVLEILAPTRRAPSVA